MMISNLIFALLEVLAPWAVTLALDVPMRTATVPVCMFPTDIAINVVTDEVFVLCPSGVLTVIDGRTNRPMTIVLYGEAAPCFRCPRLLPERPTRP